MAVEVDVKSRMWVTLLSGFLVTFLSVTGFGDITLKELAMKIIGLVSGGYVSLKTVQNAIEARNGKNGGSVPPITGG